MKEFSLDALALHDGKDEKLPVLFSVRGMVFDVTSGKGFYGPGASVPLHHSPWTSSQTPECCLRTLSMNTKAMRQLQDFLLDTSTFSSVLPSVLCTSSTFVVLPRQDAHEFACLHAAHDMQYSHSRTNDEESDVKPKFILDCVSLGSCAVERISDRGRCFPVTQFSLQVAHTRYSQARNVPGHSRLCPPKLAIAKDNAL